MYEHKKLLTWAVKQLMKVTEFIWGQHANGMLWNIVEHRPLSYFFNRIVPCNAPYILLEFSKCGATWSRYMIYQACAIVYPDIPVDEIMKETVYGKYDLPRLRSTTDFVFSRGTRKKGILFLVRQPERVMVSFYYHVCYWAHQHTMSISEFIRHPIFGIKAYADYVNDMVIKMHDWKHLIVRYEDMRADTFGNLKKILEFMELSLSDPDIRRVVEMGSFENMKLAEQERRYDVAWLNPPSKDPRAQRVRSGGKDKLEELFTPEDLALMKETYSSMEVFKKLGYCN